MALNAAALQLAGAAIANGIKFISFHTGDPGGSGTSNVIAGGRFGCTLASSGGNITLSAPVNATGLTPSANVTHIGLWSASTGGTYYGSSPRTQGDAAVNVSGAYTVLALNIPGSSS